jgi:hypothetical protein
MLKQDILKPIYKSAPTHVSRGDTAVYLNRAFNDFLIWVHTCSCSCSFLRECQTQIVGWSVFVCKIMLFLSAKFFCHLNSHLVDITVFDGGHGTGGRMDGNNNQLTNSWTTVRDRQKVSMGN